MTGMQTFGDPDRFEISARWVQDQEPRDRLPKDHGWSMGELCIKVGGVTLTEHRIHGESKEAIQWYLGPVVAWLLSQWKWLMHEEAYTWKTHSGESAAFTVEADLERYMASAYPSDRLVYKHIRAWWMRHALRSADPSALLPSIVIRRVEDTIEVSWLDKQPDFSPEGHELNLNPGVALFPVEEVAKPLWEFLQWATTSAQPVTQDDHTQVQSLRKRLEATQRTQSVELEAAYMADDICHEVMDKIRSSHWIPNGKALTDIPVVTQFDMPVLMFGGLNVDIGTSDVRKLFDVLVQQHRGTDDKELAGLVSSPSIYEYLQPYTHGYELAYQIREALQIDTDVAFVDVEKHLERLGIAIQEIDLQTNSVRGVAIAGEDFLPTIVINTSHKFNNSARGRRFTLAHEFCHILFDRSRAKRLSHISGPWTSGRVEKRANAFAAMFLATPHALERALNSVSSRDRKVINKLAETFGIGTGALLEHLRNFDLISEDDFQAISGYRYH